MPRMQPDPPPLAVSVAEDLCDAKRGARGVGRSSFIQAVWLLLVCLLAVVVYVHHLHVHHLQATVYELKASLDDLRLVVHRLSGTSPVVADAVRDTAVASKGAEADGVDPDDPGAGSSLGRRLGIWTVGTSNHGCYQISTEEHVEFEVNGASCNGNNCPSCFVTSPSKEQTLTISECSGHKWGRGSATRVGIWDYTFVNLGSANLQVTSGTETYEVSPNSHVTAYCSSSGTTNKNKLYFPSTHLPTLTVANGFTLLGGALEASKAEGGVEFGSGGVTVAGGGVTVTAGGATVTAGGLTVTAGGMTLDAGDFDASDSTGAFKTSTGEVSLSGNTVVVSDDSNKRTFKVGSAAHHGDTTLYGSLTVEGTASFKDEVTLQGKDLVCDKDPGNVCYKKDKDPS